MGQQLFGLKECFSEYRRITVSFEDETTLIKIDHRYGEIFFPQKVKTFGEIVDEIKEYLADE